MKNPLEIKQVGGGGSHQYHLQNTDRTAMITYTGVIGIVQSIIWVQFPEREGDWLLTMRANVMKTKGAE